MYKWRTGNNIVINTKVWMDEILGCHILFYLKWVKPIFCIIFITLLLLHSQPPVAHPNFTLLAECLK